MIDRLGSLIQGLKGCVGELDVGQVGGDEAMELCARFAELERLAAAGRLLTAERVKATEVWRRGGSRTAADWVSRRTGVDPERAKDGLETADRLAVCPVVAAEVRAGRLSEAQAHVIVDALGVRPDAESRLVEFAATNSLRRLREECPTDLENCGLLCKRHHDMKTYLGWVLARAEDGTWTFTPPGDYRDPEPADPAVGATVFYDPWTGRPPEPSQGQGGGGGRAHAGMVSGSGSTGSGAGVAISLLSPEQPVRLPRPGNASSADGGNVRTNPPGSAALRTEHRGSATGGHGHQHGPQPVTRSLTTKYAGPPGR